MERTKTFRVEPAEEGNLRSGVTANMTHDTNKIMGLPRFLSCGCWCWLFWTSCSIYNLGKMLLWPSCCNYMVAIKGQKPERKEAIHSEKKEKKTLRR